MTGSLSRFLASHSAWPAVVILLLSATGARAEEQYFVLVFAAESAPNLPRHSHSWATFIKADGSGPSPDLYQVEAHTISWLPRSLDIEPLRLLPECGVNLDLETTLRWAHSMNLSVSMWGPYQIDRALYNAALAQIAHLQSGTVRYKAVDAAHPARSVSNCIHAVSDLAERAPLLRVDNLNYGCRASYWIVMSFRPWILNGSQTYPWVTTRLGIGGYPILPCRTE